MQDISLHLLDIIENSARANANVIVVNITVEVMKNLIEFEILDDGVGMDAETLEMAQNPFYTSKAERKKKVGLGIPLFRQNAEACDGYFSIDSTPGEGTILRAGFAYDHIDRMPLGNVSDTVLSSIMGHPEVEFLLNLKRIELTGEKVFEFSTLEIKEELGDVPITYPDVILVIDSMLKEGIINTGMEEL
jgi:hypothetical protein